MNYDAEFTKNWWRNVLKDQTKLRKWLQKLQRTELEGYYDHHGFMAYTPVDERTRLILTNIAEDESKHSNMIVGLLSSRGWYTEPSGEASSYWDEILSHVGTVQEYCAANYYGEALAAFRFQCILDVEETPDDIRKLIEKVLPDEVFHRETLQRLAGQEALDKFEKICETAYANLTGKN